MIKSREERIEFAQVNDMPMDFVDWFFDHKAPTISDSMILCAAAFMFEGWKGNESQYVIVGHANPQSFVNLAFGASSKEWMWAKAEDGDTALRVKIKGNK